MKMVVLDIFLGLILIYLLYSIFITIIAEMLSTWFGLRARMLRYGITNMLSDSGDNLTKKFRSKVFDFFLIEPVDFEQTRAGQFYEQPSIKRLAQNVYKNKQGRSLYNLFEKRKPSYIAKESFSSTIITMLREHGRGIHDWGKIGFSIRNNTLLFDPEVNQYLNAMYEDSDDDMEVFIQKLEFWYEEITNRINGWFKRKLRFIIFWLGLIVAVSFNVDTFEITSKLSKDDSLRQQFAQLAISAAKDSSEVSNLVKELQGQLNEEELYKIYNEISGEIEGANILLGNGWRYESKEYRMALKPTRFNEQDIVALDEKMQMTNAYSDSLKNVINYLSTPGLEFEIVDSLLHLKREYELELDRILSEINTTTRGRFSSVQEISTIGGKQYLIGQVEPRWFGRVVFISKQCFAHPKKIWGFLLTAFAICLGAPFWFDLLKKLVALRGAGIKPKEKAKDQQTTIDRGDKKSKRGRTIKHADAVDITIEAHRAKWEATPGVIAINKILIKKDGNTSYEHAIEITHKKDYDLRLIDDGVKNGKRKAKIDVVKIVGKVASFNNTTDKLELKDDLRSGTIAGVLKNKDTAQKCILTCGHVISSDGQSIVYQDGRHIKSYGKISKLIWSNMLDAGVIDLDEQGNASDEKFGYIPAPYLYESGDDILGKKVFIQTKTGHKRGKDNEEKKEPFQEAKDKIEVVYIDYDYPLTNEMTGLKYQLFDLIAIAIKDGDDYKPVSESGDSGALVCISDKDGENRKSLGIVIGSYKNDTGLGLTFVFPMKKILKTLNLQIL